MDAVERVARMLFDADFPDAVWRDAEPDDQVKYRAKAKYVTEHMSLREWAEFNRLGVGFDA